MQKRFKTDRLLGIGPPGDKLVLEIPRSRPTRLYKTQLRLNSLVPWKNEQLKFLDYLQKASHFEIFTTVGEIKTRLSEGFPGAPQYERAYELLENWVRENLSEQQIKYCTMDRKNYSLNAPEQQVLKQYRKGLRPVWIDPAYITHMAEVLEQRHHNGCITFDRHKVNSVINAIQTNHIISDNIIEALLYDIAT